MNKIRRATRLLEDKVNKEYPRSDESCKKYTTIASDIRHRLVDENELGKMDKNEYKSIKKRLFKIDFPTTNQTILMNNLERMVRSPDFMDSNRRQDIFESINSEIDRLTYAQRVRLKRFAKNGEEYHRQERWNKEAERELNLAQEIKDLSATFTEEEAGIFGSQIEKLSFDGLRNFKYFQETLKNYQRRGGIEMSEKYWTTDGYDNPSSESRSVSGNVAEYNMLMDNIKSSDLPRSIKDYFSARFSEMKRYH